MQKKLNHLQNLNFFAQLDEKQLQTVLSISNVVKHPKGSILYYENDVHDKMLFLMSGLLKVYKIDKYDNEIFLYHIRKNSLISELGRLEDESILCYSNTEFVEDGVVLEVNFKELRNHFLDKNVLKNEFIAEMLLKTQQLHSVVNREVVFDATAKVAYMLSNDLEIFNSLKRQEVSFMLHIQPETLSRILKKLKRNELIDTHNANIVITNDEALKKIYQG